MKSNECMLNQRIFKSVFGVMAFKRFLEKGPNDRLRDEQMFLLDFVNNHLEKIDLLYAKKISVLDSFKSKPLCPFQNNSSIASSNKNEIFFKNIVDSLNELDCKKLLDQETIIVKNIRNSNSNHLNNFLNDLVKYKVPKRYTEHLLWLKINSHLFYEKFKSFYKLILEVYFPPEYNRLKKQKVILENPMEENP
jgi:hypothetical protein